MCCQPSSDTKTFVQKNFSRTLQKSRVVSAGTANVCLVVEERPSPDEADCARTAHEEKQEKNLQDNHSSITKFLPT